MKNTLSIVALTFYFVLSTLYLIAQPTIQWEKSLGGSNAEWASEIKQTIDGGYIVCGISGSSDGDLNLNNGGGDCWIVKLGISGNIEWQKSYGGTGNDNALSIVQTNDSGYIFSGTPASVDGDVVGSHGCSDFWIVKLNTIGNIEWQKSYGGGGCDAANQIILVADGGYLAAGSNFSNGGDVTGNHGFPDFWVIKMDSIGNLKWQKSLGGSSYESAYSVQQTNDLGYIVAGYSQSNNGDVTSNNGGKDYWLTKLDTSGNLLWQKNYGGSDDDIAYDVKQTTDGGYIIAGTSNSTDGNITGVNNGGIDAWIVKTDGLGTIEWEKLYGGSLNDDVRSVLQIANGDYVFAGSSSSGNGDIWVVDIDSLGIVKWQQVYGGSSLDYANCISQTNDNGFIVCGGSTSLDGDVTGNHGLDDFWVVKLNPVIGMAEQPFNNQLLIYPNPVENEFRVDFKCPNGVIEVYDMLGQKIISIIAKAGNNTIYVNNIKTGSYIVKVKSEGGMFTAKLIIK